MTLLSKEQILAADDLKSDTVEVPEWGGSVCLAVMTATARDAFEASQMKRVGDRFEPDFSNARAKLIAACAVDAEGKRLFTVADVEALGKKSSAALDRLATVARKLNGLSDEAVEDTVKN